MSNKEYAHNWYQQHKNDPEFRRKRNEYNRKWSSSNRVVYNQKKRDYFNKNKKKYNQSSLKYFYKNKERLNAKSLEYYYKNRERLLQYNRTYLKKNPRSSPMLPPDIRESMQRVRLRDNNTCQWFGCGLTSQDVPINVHHIFPQSEYPDLATVEQYMICYCEDHHRLWHRSRWKSGKTKRTMTLRDMK